MFELRYRISGAVPSGARVRYKVLHPGEPYVQSEDTWWAGAGTGGVLPATFAGGTRVFVLAEAYDPDLACRYRIGALREALP